MIFVFLKLNYLNFAYDYYIERWPGNHFRDPGPFAHSERSSCSARISVTLTDVLTFEIAKFTLCNICCIFYLENNCEEISNVKNFAFSS